MHLPHLPDNDSSAVAIIACLGQASASLRCCPTTLTKCSKSMRSSYIWRSPMGLLQQLGAAASAAQTRA